MSCARSSGTTAGKSVRMPVSTAISIILRIARPATTIERPDASATRASVWSRETLDANDVAATAPSHSASTRSRCGTISASDPARPGRNTLVESQASASTPSSPSFLNGARSAGAPIRGSGSSLKSPVCSAVPAAVRIATDDASGIEWVIGRNSTSNRPSRTRSPGPTTLSGGSPSPASSNLRRTTSAVNGRATIGTPSRSQRWAIAPTWSSWACVSTMASSASSSSSSRKEMSGSTSSTPGAVSMSPKPIPQSTISQRRSRTGPRP